MIRDRHTSILLLKTHRLGYFSYYQQGRKQAWETTVLKVPLELLLLLGSVWSCCLCVGWVLTETHPGEKSITAAPQSCLLSEVCILLTLKSLICKNSSMIDLHFLSISSSDSEGFSCTGAGGTSGLAGGNTTTKKCLKKENQHFRDDTLRTEVTRAGVSPVLPSGSG